MYDSLFFTLCPQFLINKFLLMTCQESRSVSKTQYQTVVRIPELFLKLTSVQITALLCGLPAILIQRKETMTVKCHTGFPLYCVMIWSVLLSKKNDRVYKIRVLARYYCVDFFPYYSQARSRYPARFLQWVYYSKVESVALVVANFRFVSSFLRA